MEKQSGPLAEFLQKIPPNRQIQKLIKEHSKKYQIQQYHLNSLTLTQIKQLLKTFSKRSYSMEATSSLPNQSSPLQLTAPPFQMDWQPKQLKLFIFIVLLLAAQSLVQISQILDPTTANARLLWKNLQQLFHHKHPCLLLFYINSLIKSKHYRDWTFEQDQLLLESMKKNSMQQRFFWNEVAKHIYFTSKTRIFKSGKHCRDRWYNHLNPDRRVKNWELEQDILILKSVEDKGTCWSRIAGEMGYRRTDHDIKNRYYSLVKSQKIKYKKNPEYGQIGSSLKKTKEDLELSEHTEKQNLKQSPIDKDIINMKEVINKTKTSHLNQQREQALSPQSEEFIKELLWWNYSQGSQEREQNQSIFTDKYFEKNLSPFADQ